MKYLYHGLRAWRGRIGTRAARPSIPIRIPSLGPQSLLTFAFCSSRAQFSHCGHFTALRIRPSHTFSRPFTSASKHHSGSKSLKATTFIIPTPPNRTARNVGVLLLVAIISFAAGSYATMSTISAQLLPKLTDAQSVNAFKTEHEHQQEVEAYLNSHPLVQYYRSKPEYSESRPHLKYSEEARSASLTAGALLGPGRIVIPPIVFVDERGTLVSVTYLGDEVCGYPGYVHGGLLATILDETLGRCSFTSLPNKIGMTANLNLTYRKPTVAGQYIVTRAKVVKAEGRKVWVEGHIETLPKNKGEEPVILVEASGLFIEPKQIKLMSLVTGPVSA